jgi:hypothetical protein
MDQIYDILNSGDLELLQEVNFGNKISDGIIDAITNLEPKDIDQNRMYSRERNLIDDPQNFNVVGTRTQNDPTNLLGNSLRNDLVFSGFEAVKGVIPTPESMFESVRQPKKDLSEPIKSTTRVSESPQSQVDIFNIINNMMGQNQNDIQPGDPNFGDFARKSILDDQVNSRSVALETAEFLGLKDEVRNNILETQTEDNNNITGEIIENPLKSQTPTGEILTQIVELTSGGIISGMSNLMNGTENVKAQSLPQNVLGSNPAKQMDLSSILVGFNPLQYIVNNNLEGGQSRINPDERLNTTPISNRIENQRVSEIEQVFINQIPKVIQTSNLIEGIIPQTNTTNQNRDQISKKTESLNFLTGVIPNTPSGDQTTSKIQNIQKSIYNLITDRMNKDLPNIIGVNNPITGIQSDVVNNPQNPEKFINRILDVFNTITQGVKNTTTQQIEPTTQNLGNNVGVVESKMEELATGGISNMSLISGLVERAQDSSGVGSTPKGLVDQDIIESIKTPNLSPENLPLTRNANIQNPGQRMNDVQILKSAPIGLQKSAVEPMMGAKIESFTTPSPGLRSEQPSVAAPVREGAPPAPVMSEQNMSPQTNITTSPESSMTPTTGETTINSGEVFAGGISALSQQMGLLISVVGEISNKLNYLDENTGLSFK